MATIFIQGAGGGKPEEEKQVALALADGNQVVTPTDGKTLSKVTVEKPTTLTPGNVKEGVTIAGVTGTFAGSGEQPKPEEEKTVTAVLAPRQKINSNRVRFSRFTLERP